jgi:hypothetical protein
MPPTLTPEPTPQMVLGMDTGLAVEWDDELGSYAHLVNVNPNFWLDETNGVITRVTVFVIDRPSLDWQAPTDQFFEDCNLPRPMLGGVAAFMDTYQGKLSTDSTVTIHPVPGIEFTVHEWGIGLRLLSYTLID